LNVKEFKTRWLRGYIQPDLFKLPLKNDTDDFEPMIIEVEAISSDRNYTLYPSSWIGSVNVYHLVKDEEGIITSKSSVGNYVLYNVTTKDGKKVTKSMFPEYFSKFLNNILFEEKEPFFKVDWGDGNFIDYTSQIVLKKNRKIFIDGVECTSDSINDSVRQTVTNSDGTTTTTIVPIVHHQYEKDGRYTIKIYGNIGGFNTFYNSLILSPTASNCKLKKIIKWGNLHLRSTASMLNANKAYNSSSLNRYYKPEYIQPLSELKHNEFKYVINAREMFYQADITLEDIGITDLSMFSNLIISDEMFAGTMVNCIPNKFLQYNKKLQSMSSMFYACPLTYIGDYALSDLPDCMTGNTVVDTRVYRSNNPNYFYKNNIASDVNTISTLQKIGNSVFENDINFSGQVDFEGCNRNNENWSLTQIGDYVFRNCRSLKQLSGIFRYSLRLKTVGKGLFENCINLEDVNNLFFLCPSLTTIGEEIFKNCFHLKKVDSIFYGCPKLTLPDKLFYDLQVCDSNNNPIVNSTYDNKKIRLSIRSLVNSYTENTPYDAPNVYFYWDSGSFLKNSPDVADIYNEYISYDIHNFPQVKLGKDMFNKQFLQDCIKYDMYINNYIDRYACTYTKVTKITDNNELREIRSLYSGEAPDIWNYETRFIGHTNAIFGFTESDISDSANNRAITHKPEFTNISDVPLPKVTRVESTYDSGWWYEIVKDTYLGLYETPTSGGGAYTWEVEEV
jgi:hypothetical protein